MFMALRLYQGELGASMSFGRGVVVSPDQDHEHQEDGGVSDDHGGGSRSRRTDSKARGKNPAAK